MSVQYSRERHEDRRSRKRSRQPIKLQRKLSRSPERIEEDKYKSEERSEEVCEVCGGSPCKWKELGSIVVKTMKIL
jgi:ubiquitin